MAIECGGRPEQPTPAISAMSCRRYSGNRQRATERSLYRFVWRLESVGLGLRALMHPSATLAPLLQCSLEDLRGLPRTLVKKPFGPFLKGAVLIQNDWIEARSRRGEFGEQDRHQIGHLIGGVLCDSQSEAAQQILAVRFNDNLPPRPRYCDKEVA